jgi:3-deoxy-manno-octulosonate cytidylyltransferase (CMP-KDO synthetase)
MIVHVLRRGLEAGIGPVVVACGDQAIVDVVRDAGGQAVLTDPALPTGSDRAHAALGLIDPEARHDVIVVLQGDASLA